MSNKLKFVYLAGLIGTMTRFDRSFVQYRLDPDRPGYYLYKNPNEIMFDRISFSLVALQEYKRNVLIEVLFNNKPGEEYFAFIVTDNQQGQWGQLKERFKNVFKEVEVVHKSPKFCNANYFYWNILELNIVRIKHEPSDTK